MEAFASTITDSVVRIFGDHIWLATIIISMIPITELKVGIPFAMSRGYGFWLAILCGMAGSAIIVPILALIFTPILNGLKKTRAFKKLAESIEKKLNTKSQKIKNNSETIEEENPEKRRKKASLLKFLGVMTFVAVPIPLTGIWTGTCLAVILGLGFWKTCGAVLAGNFIAGTLVFSLTKIIGEEQTFLMMLFLVIILIIYLIVKHIIKKAKEKNKTKK